MSEDYRKLGRRVKSVEEAIQLLTQMALRADERSDRLDERTDGLDASLNNLTVKMEALVDAQIHTEEVLAGKFAALGGRVEALAVAQIRTEEALTRLAESERNLAERQAHTDGRLDALIDIIRKEREGRDGRRDGPQ